MICADCQCPLLPGQGADVNPYDRHDDARICDDCIDTRAEAASVRQFEDYHGGAGPDSLTRQQELARKVKRSHQ